jgi:actin-related protein
MAQRPQKPFEFPDGYNNTFGAERYRVPEIMFNPNHISLVRSCILIILKSFIDRCN